jgi:hypothetical protein
MSSIATPFLLGGMSLFFSLMLMPLSYDIFGGQFNNNIFIGDWGVARIVCWVVSIGLSTMAVWICGLLSEKESNGEGE